MGTPTEAAARAAAQPPQPGPPPSRKRRLSMSGGAMASASLLPFGPAAPGVFDRVASRRLRPQGSEWVLEAEGVRAYLPSLLRLLRDADESKDGATSLMVAKEGEAAAASQQEQQEQEDEEEVTARVLDKLMEIAIRYPMADTIEEYLSASQDIGRGRSAQTPTKLSVAMSATSILAIKEEVIIKKEVQPPTQQQAPPPAHQEVGEREMERNAVLRFESGAAAERVALVLEELERLVLRCSQQAVHVDGVGSGGGGGRAGGQARGEEAAEVLDRTSFQQELGALLPLLLAYNPRRLSLPQVTEALLCHAKLAPTHLVAVVQNEPRGLSGVLQGIGQTMAKLDPGAEQGKRRGYGAIRRRAQDLCLRLAALSPSTAAEVRASLRARRQLPEVCACLSRTRGDWPLFLYGLLPARGVGGGLAGGYDDDDEEAAAAQDWFWEWVAGLEDGTEGGSTPGTVDDEDEEEVEDEEGDGSARGRHAAEARRRVLAPTLAELVAAVWEGQGEGEDGEDEVGPVARLKATCALLAHAGAAVPWHVLYPAWECVGRVLKSASPAAPASSLLVALLAALVVGSHAAERDLSFYAMGTRLVDAAALGAGGGGGDASDGGQLRVLALRLLLWLGAEKAERVVGLAAAVLLHARGAGREGEGAGGGGEEPENGGEESDSEVSGDEEGERDSETMAVDREPQQPEDEAGARGAGSGPLQRLRAGVEAMVEAMAAVRTGPGGAGGGAFGVCTERSLLRAVLSLPLSLACPVELLGVAGSSLPNGAITPLACLHEALVQGLPARQGLDLHDTMVRLLQAPAPSSAATGLDPWALPLVLAFAAATVPHPSGRKTEAAVVQHHHHPLLPKHIHAILAPAVHQALGKGGGAATAPAVHASTAATLLLSSSSRSPATARAFSSSSLFRRQQQQQQQQAVANKPTPGQQEYEAYVGLVTLCYALARERRARERQGPFPHPFGYELESLPLPGLLALAQRRLDGPDAGCWARLHGKLVALAMDQFPDLFSPAQLAAIADGQQEQGGDPEAEAAAVLAELEAVLLASAPLDADEAEAWQREQQQSVVLRDLSSRWLRLRRRSPNPVELDHRTLRAFLRAAAEGEGGASAVPLGRRGAAQEPLLVFRAPRWAFGVPALLRVLLTILDGLLRASRVEAAQATAAAMWKTELPLASRDGGHGSQQEGGRGRPPSPVSAAAATAAVLAQAEEGRLLGTLQDAIVAKCLLSAAAAAGPASVEARQESCAFLQQLLAANPPALRLLVQRGLSAPDMALLLDGVPALLASRSILGGLARGSSLVVHAHALAFITEFARRWPVEEAYQAAKEGIGQVLNHHLRPLGLKVCQVEGEDVGSACESICQSILTLARQVFPALAPFAHEATSRALQDKEMRVSGVVHLERNLRAFLGL